MKNILFIAINDAKYQLRQGSTLVWLFLMPPIFFYFIGINLPTALLDEIPTHLAKGTHKTI